MSMSRQFVSVVLIACVMTFGLAGTTRAQDGTPAADASPIAATSFQVTGLVNTPLTVTAADLQAMTAQSVEVDFQSGQGAQHHAYTGVLLSDVIAKAGLKTNDDV